MLLKELRATEKPRERFMSSGSSALSTAELLALFIRTGNNGVSVIELAQTLLHEFETLADLLQASVEELASVKGIGVVKAVTLKAIWELHLRLLTETRGVPVLINGPEDAFNYVKAKLSSKDIEHLYLLSLNSKGYAIALDLISVGTLTETYIDTREIFRKAIRRNAHAVILLHNHPSQVTTPSAEDIEATAKIAAAGTFLNIPVLDHLIVCANGYASLKSLNLLESKTKGKEVKK